MVELFCCCYTSSFVDAPARGAVQFQHLHHDGGIHRNLGQVHPGHFSDLSFAGRRFGYGHFGFGSRYQHIQAGAIVGGNIYPETVPQPPEPRLVK